MNIGISNFSGPQAPQGSFRSTASTIQSKAHAPAEEVLGLRPGLVASLRETVLQEAHVRPDVVARGSTLLSDPSYPQIDKLNAIGSIIVNDFFLKKGDSYSD